MHAVRRQAHRTASHGGANGAMNYNPFARQRARDHLYDEENLTQTRSEAGRVPTIEEQRRLEEREAAKEHGAPPYLPTEPTYTPADAPEIITGNGLIRDGWDSTVVGFSEETTPHVSSTESTEGVKKRSKFKRPFRGHNDLDDEALANGSSENLSWEERKQKALKRKIPVGQQFRFIVFHEWAYVGLLAFIPTGFALYYTHVNVVAVFCVNFIAIIPSAAMLSNAVGELSIRLGDNVGALLNMTFGNAVQLILSVLLLKSHQISVLKLSLLGTMLCNLLLTTGASFLLGGYNRDQQFFNKDIALIISTVLLLAVASLVIPSAAHLMASTSTDGMRAQSRGISVVIMASYALWILFQLKTNQEMFKEPSPKTPKRASRISNDRAVGKGVAAIGAGAAAASGGWVNARMLVKKVPSDNDEEVEEEQGEEEEGFETPSLSLIGATTALVVSVVLVAFNTEFTTNSIQALLQRRNVSQTFLSLIILPLLSTDFLAVGVAMKDKMDMSISLTLERCMQTSLMVIPLTVLLAWIMGIDEMDLKFDGFPITALFASIVIVTYVVQEGKSNWLVGALLIKGFIIIALSAFYMP